MLKIKYRNVEIIASNHDDLLRSEVTLALKNIKDIFDTAEHALKHNPPANVCYSVTRLNKSDKLIAACMEIAFAGTDADAMFIVEKGKWYSI